MLQESISMLMPLICHRNDNIFEYHSTESGDEARLLSMSGELRASFTKCRSSTGIRSRGGEWWGRLGLSGKWA